MKHILLSLAVITFSLSVFGQNLKERKAIPLNSKFTLKLITDKSGKYDYEIVKVEEYTTSINMSSIHTEFDEVAEDMIQGFFGTGKFGDKESALLAIKSGAEEMLQYELFMDTQGREKYEKTSTSGLLPGLPSIEMWPYHIYSIKIGSFNKGH